MTQRQWLRIPEPAFWNLALMCVLGYGGIVLLLPTYLGLGRLFPDIGHIGNAGLAVVLLSGGTAGLFLLRGLFERRGWWRDAVAFGVSLNIACGLAAARLGQLDLAVVIAILAGGEALLGTLLLAARKGAADRRSQ